ncbi:NAD(P)/FAD-dependent oxidoreductase [Celeribacter halophilus]|uniref:D-amino-acid dehydrogenase n=1 Tax=Celeribacter halophilus TaxID=576117 RepID=A0A1I3V7Y6_9RHOB|nr:FAD-dependent oxidoreductase [Celeribacter halophilus]PZX09569.1 D-amino-acid dehydrogenase [Celeribacter halophilus]SFJ91528.1 D-amino-acid dehydrogenase [Celeribacter halophilus]
MQHKKVAIIGAGIVGLACAWHVLQSGHTVVLIDPAPEGDKASFGNAGGIAVSEVVPASAPGVFLKLPKWLFDPLGPLSLRWTHAPRLLPWMLRFSRVSTRSEMERIAGALSALNNRTYDDLMPLLNSAGLSDKLYNHGALTVYESEMAFQADAAEWELKRQHGVTCTPMSGDEARQLEPALGGLAHKAMFTPQWSQVSDPKDIHNGLLDTVLRNGATIARGAAKRINRTATGVRVEMDGDADVSADLVVLAAGAWSKPLAASIGDRVLLESERGYNTTLPTPGISVTRELIFAERKFVATPLATGLRIGGAAEFGGLTSKPNFKRSEALVKLAKRYLPDLDSDQGIQWSGHRPATPDSLPVIGRSPNNRNVIHAFGHGHLGLTQAATTGRLVADLIDNKPASLDLTPYRIERFTYGA